MSASLICFWLQVLGMLVKQSLSVGAAVGETCRVRPWRTRRCSFCVKKRTCSDQKKTEVRCEKKVGTSKEGSMEKCRFFHISDISYTGEVIEKWQTGNEKAQVRVRSKCCTHPIQVLNSLVRRFLANEADEAKPCPIG